MEDDTTTALLDDEECGAPQTKTSDPPSTTSCNLLALEKIDSVLSGPFLRGNNVKFLPFLPDPTKSRQQREQYTKYVVPFAVASALSPGGPLYGFNVWLLPICLEIYGPDAQYTMKNGMVLYAFTAQVISAAIICLLFSKKLVNWSSGQLMLISTFCFNLALVLCGVCVWYQSDWGLFLVMFFVTGPSRAILALSTLLKAVGWYREIHRPALGAGIFGLILGVWATLFSLWGAALANISVRDSFFWVALITAIMMVPSIFLLRSPEELPLRIDNDSKDGDNNTNDTSLQSKKAGFKENTDCPELTAAELSRTRQIWIQDVSWILVMMPGMLIVFVVWLISDIDLCISFCFITCLRLCNQVYDITRHVSPLRG